MKSLLQTTHCRSKAHCRACRDSGKVGAAFRLALARLFILPGPGLFACPHGADPEPLAEPEPTPAFALSRLSECEKCRDDCAVKHKTACERAAYTKRAGACCPATPPKWTPQDPAEKKI